jgi:hypothetical protein
MKTIDFNRWPGAILYIVFVACCAFVYAFAGKYFHDLLEYVPVWFIYALCFVLTVSSILLFRSGICSSKNLYLWFGLACITLAGLIFMGLHFNVMQNPAMQGLP